MSSTKAKTPRYCRQKEKGRSDRAYTVIEGRRVQLGNYGSPESYERYTTLVNKSAAKEPAQPAPTAYTISMLIAVYLAHAIEKFGGEKASEVVHIKSAMKILRRTHGASLARDFGPKAFQVMRRGMIDNGWCRNYISDQCQRVKRMVGWGVVEEVLPRDAKHALDAVPGLTAGEFGCRETAEVPPVADDMIAATLLQLKPMLADMVRIQRLTAMRPGELVQLSAEHIDRNGAVWMFRPPQHKNKKRGKSRKIALGPKAQSLVSKYLFSSPCFPYSTASYRRAVHRACQRAGVQAWHPNQIRHTSASAIREEFGLEHAQVILGHSRANTTEIYALANQNKAIEAALRIG